MKILLDEIKNTGQIREHGDINGLKQSIKKLGLLEPLGITKDKILVYGRRRFQALKELGFKEAEVTIVEPKNRYENFLMSLHENTKRKNLTWQEECNFLLKEKLYYEQQFPETKHGGDRKSKNFQVPDSGTRYTKIKASLENVSESVIQENIQLAKALREYPELKKQSKKSGAKKVLKRIKDKERNIEREKEFDNIPLPKTIKIWKGKFQSQSKKIPPGSIDAIITDPPYSKEYLKDWKDLSLIAKKVLKPSGFLITYSGILNLNEVFKIFDKNLIYYWQFIILHTGVKQLINPRNIFCGYKPILVYQKEPFKRINNQIGDIIEGAGREKEEHPWQQAEEEIKVLIKNFTKPNDLILDPFAGGGTIPVACHKLKRKVIAIDDKKENIKTIETRLKEYESTKLT